MAINVNIERMQEAADSLSESLARNKADVIVFRTAVNKMAAEDSTQLTAEACRLGKTLEDTYNGIKANLEPLAENVEKSLGVMINLNKNISGHYGNLKVRESGQKVNSFEMKSNTEMPS